MRLRHLLLAAFWLALGIFVLVYSGPGRALVRGALGDVVVVPFLVHCAGVVVPRLHGWRIAAVGALAVGLEVLQLAELVGPDAPTWAHLIFGSTFDPWDLLGYTVGMGISAAVAWWLARADARPSPEPA